jgi:cystathionine beta-synthase
MKDQLKKDDVVVIIFHDHGTRYLGKMYNDDWLREMDYLK